MSLAELYQLLGKVVLLIIPYGTKRPTGLGWEQRTYEQTLAPAYQVALKIAWQGLSNIGVLLGPPSDHLGAFDVDSDLQRDQFLALNSSLQDTFRTKGARGCQLWVRPKPGTNYPNGQSYYPLKNQDGTKFGEWRCGCSGGAQSILKGKHPEGEIFYSIEVANPPKEIDFATIKFPPQVILPWLSNQEAKPPKPERETNPEREEPETHYYRGDAQLDSEEEEPEAAAKVFIEFLSPAQVQAYQVPSGFVLVGDNHLVRDSVAVLGGAPGVGKSRAGVALARSGATLRQWLGLPVHTRFKTLIIQNENGRYRLKTELAELACPELEDYLRISPPPPFGLRFDKSEFRDQLTAYLETFQPALVIIDPWNAVARDDRAKDYLETFNLLRSVFKPGQDGPGILVIAHTRKPLANERSSGRALLNLLAGSYVLGSVPRSVFVMQHASDAVDENRVVLTCCKNNDGELGERSAWHRSRGLFLPALGFDWRAWDHPEGEKEESESPLNEGALAEIFENGTKKLKKGEAVDALMKLSGRKKTVCYDALDTEGRFARWLELEGGFLSFKP